MLITPVTVRTPEASVPVVERFSLPKEMAPEESVMEPPVKVRVPRYEVPDTVSAVEDAYGVVTAWLVPAVTRRVPS